MLLESREKGKDILGFELVGEDQVCVVQKISVHGDNRLADIKTAFIAHDRVQNCI